ncbi:DUF2510 domain-containing protein [Catellatospora sp. NPDC049609]|uniref:DUF2510 domain-containing protein n=1 Tax=Catellatospora sp. NPDC049609 TaxID=3155505 RepID=UPI003426BB8D
MTTYRRRGHWRRSPGGGRHWVGAHDVTRAGSTPWRRPSSARSYRAVAYVPVPRAPQPPRSFSARWLRPNARCPVCGALVFFYANEHGSRVFFDEVGPPWPKHPCTDTAAYRAQSAAGVPRSSPTRYGFFEGRSAAQHATSLDGRADGGLTLVGRSYGATAWSPYLVLMVEAAQTGMRLTLRRLYTLEAATVWTTTSTVALAGGDVVFLRAGQMSCFDMGRHEAVTLPVSFAGTANTTGVLSRLRELLAGRPATSAPANWYADPTGRHVYRYWNGSRWTEHVSPGNGSLNVDPLQ